ncbi:MAG: PhoH family protein, partial [Firmicutes bacterium]|nr:PhoH family protein [Bacillota bacterium]
MTEKTVKLQIGDNVKTMAILGEHDTHLKMLEETLSARIVVRGDEISINGQPDEVGEAVNVFSHLLALAAAGQTITTASVNYALATRFQPPADLPKAFSEPVYVTAKGRIIRAKTIGQWQYLQTIRDHDLAFGIGPAGTGKTYLAVAMAVAALKNRRVNRIILARPAVEAGEKLGFLPGDLQDKVNPYLRPVYDALDETLGQEQARKQMERGAIEVVPLAYMRGRTLEEAFIILDEAQNTTLQQMKMFLTRMGLGSIVVINGDITQVDLPTGQMSGLVEAEKLLTGIRGIGFC